MLLMLYLMRSSLMKATLLAIIKTIYSFKFSSFIILNISLIRAIPLYSSARYFMPFK
jgi:hypothetical protein